MTKPTVFTVLCLCSITYGTPVTFESLPVYVMPYTPYIDTIVSNMTPHVLQDGSDNLKVVGWSFEPGDIFYQDKLFLKLTDNMTGECIYIEHSKWHIGQTQVFDYSSGGFQFVPEHSYTWSYFVDIPEPSMLMLLPFLFWARR